LIAFFTPGKKMSTEILYLTSWIKHYSFKQTDKFWKKLFLHQIPQIQQEKRKTGQKKKLTASRIQDLQT